MSEGPREKDRWAGWLAGREMNESSLPIAKTTLLANEARTGRMPAGRRDGTPVLLSWLPRTALLRQLGIGDTLRGVVAHLTRESRVNTKKDLGVLSKVVHTED